MIQPTPPAGRILLTYEDYCALPNDGRRYEILPHNVVQPDLVFISRERSHLITDKNIAGPPDLVIEILSPTTAETDRRTKAHLHARYGVDHYWLVDPEAQVLEEYWREGEVFVHVGTYQGPVRFNPRCFPDLCLDLAKVWGER